MYKITVFAKLCGTTNKTIRFYDRVGILKANYIDNANGYRYYSREKIVDFYKILSLKQIGFTIQQIRDHLINASDERVLEMLTEKESEFLSAYENCKKMKSKYEEKIKIHQERTNRAIIECDYEKSIIYLPGITEIYCSPDNISACYEILNDMVNIPGVVNIDVWDVREINKSKKPIHFGYGTASGENKEIIAANLVLDAVKKSKNFLMTVKISSNESLAKIEAICDIVMKNADQDACIIWGASFLQDVDDVVGVSVIGFD